MPVSYVKIDDQFLSTHTLEYMPAIWLMIDIEDDIVHKHGSYEFVKGCYDNYHKRLIGGIHQAENQEDKDAADVMIDVASNMLDVVVMVNISSIPIAEINDAFERTGTWCKLLEKYNIQEEKPWLKGL